MSTEGRAARHPSSIDPSVAGRRRRTRWIALAVVAGCVAALTALFAFGLGRDPTAVQSVLVGRRATEFSLTPLGGGPPLGLSGFRGKVVVVNFWASWCAQCRTEQPALSEVWQANRDRGVVFLGIPWEDPRSASLDFASAFGMRWPLLADPGSRTAIDFGVAGVPETYVIGRDGRIAAAFKGPVGYSQLSAAVASALKETP